VHKFEKVVRITQKVKLLHLSKRRFTKMSKQEAPDLSQLTIAGAGVAPEQPRSIPPELLTPAAIAYMNVNTADIIKEIFRELRPMLEANALSPEKLTHAFTEAERLRREPTETELAFKKRQAREKKAMHVEQENNRKNLQLTQENCPHRYPNSQLAVAAVNNYHDRQPRFVCFKCQLFIQPRHWECGIMPTEENPLGTDRIVDAHPLYAAIYKEYSVTHAA
jgi:hypothetical protein